MTIGFDLGHDLDLELSRSNMEFPISQPKVVRLPWNEKQTYRLNSRPQMWPMVWIYQIVTGVTSVVGVPSTHLVCKHWWHYVMDHSFTQKDSKSAFIILLVVSPPVHLFCMLKFPCEWLTVSLKIQIILWQFRMLSKSGPLILPSKGTLENQMKFTMWQT